MSIFAHTTQATAPVPQDPPHTFTYRKLTGREVEEAQAAHLRTFQGGKNPSLWAIGLRHVADGTLMDETVKAALADPLLGFDRYVIVKAGLVAWTYNGGAPTPEEIDDLDDEAVTLIARAILQVSKPALFLTAEEREAAKKNGSAGSTSP